MSEQLSPLSDTELDAFRAQAESWTGRSIDVGSTLARVIDQGREANRLRRCMQSIRATATVALDPTIVQVGVATVGNTNVEDTCQYGTSDIPAYPCGVVDCRRCSEEGGKP